jgi:hypothetical protein
MTNDTDGPAGWLPADKGAPSTWRKHTAGSRGCWAPMERAYKPLALTRLQG